MSDETPQPRKRGRPARPVITVAPRADESQWSAEEINRRRLSGEPFGLRGADIPLRDPGAWSLRVANSQVDDSRHYNMRHRLGWEPLTADDLAPGVTPESIGYRLSEDGRTLCKGIRGDEVLYKKPKAVDAAIQRAKADANTRALKSERAAKDEAAAAAASAHGDQAAEYLSKHAHITIRDHVGG